VKAVKKAAKAVKRNLGKNAFKKANKDIEKALREITANRN
jgi:hypothetical protein